MYNFQPGEYAPKNRVLLVKPRRRVRRDEELRAIGVGPGVRHTDRVWPAKDHKLQFIGLERSLRRTGHA